ncbi:MAG: EAL domain-containing protein, partial [Campylobacterota bacterium]|nr:EAL domain-containing protein [Campylobacterota bacterium]
NSRIIVESIVEFAKKIGAQTIAKYVNSPSVYEIVKEVGVDFSQGFFIGKPQPYLLDEGEK